MVDFSLYLVLAYTLKLGLCRIVLHYANKKKTKKPDGLVGNTARAAR